MITLRLRTIAWLCFVLGMLAGACAGSDPAESAQDLTVSPPPLPPPSSPAKPQPGPHDPWLMHAQNVGGMSGRLVLPKVVVDEQGTLFSEDRQTKERASFSKLTVSEIELLKSAIHSAPAQVESECTAPVDGVDLMLSFQRNGRWFDWQCVARPNDLTATWAAVLRRHLPKLARAQVNGKPLVAPLRQILRVSATGALSESLKRDGVSYPDSVWKFDTRPEPGALYDIQLVQNVEGKTLLYLVGWQEKEAPIPNYQLSEVAGGFHVAQAPASKGKKHGGGHTEPLALPLPPQGDKLKLSFENSTTVLELHLLPEPAAASQELGLPPR